MSKFVEYAFSELSFRLPGFDVWITDCLEGVALIEVYEDDTWSVDSVTIEGADGCGRNAMARFKTIERNSTKYAEEFCASVEASLREWRLSGVEDEIEHAPEPAREYEWGH